MTGVNPKMSARKKVEKDAGAEDKVKLMLKTNMEIQQKLARANGEIDRLRKEVKGSVGVIERVKKERDEWKNALKNAHITHGVDVDHVEKRVKEIRQGKR